MFRDGNKSGWVQVLSDSNSTQKYITQPEPNLTRDLDSLGQVGLTFFLSYISLKLLGQGRSDKIQAQPNGMSEQVGFILSSLIFLVEKLLIPHKMKVNWPTNSLVDLMIKIAQIIKLFLGFSLHGLLKDWKRKGCLGGFGKMIQLQS